MKDILKMIYRRIPLKAQIFSIVKVFGRPTFYRSLRFDGPFRVEIDEQCSFILNHSTAHYGLETEFFWNGFHDAWECISLAIWVELCRSSKCVLDIGACEGVYALSAQAVAPSDAKIIAFEPLPSAFEVLSQNCTLNGDRVDSRCIALSNQDGTAQFYFDDSAPVSTEGSLLKGAGQKSLKVKVASLDSLLARESFCPPDLIKIDVEGFEPWVFDGMSATLKRYRPAIIVEVLNEIVAERIESVIGSLDYVYFDINDDGRYGKKAGVIQRDHLRKASCLNYLLIPKERLERFPVDRWLVKNF